MKHPHRRLYRTGTGIRANWMPLRARHRIFNVDHGGVLSLVFAGPKRREWGYFTHSRFINWKEFSL